MFQKLGLRFIVVIREDHKALQFTLSIFFRFLKFDSVLVRTDFIHHFPRQSWCFMALTIFVTYVFSQVIRLHLQFLSFTETKEIIVLKSEAHDIEACNSQLFSWNKAGDFRTPTEFYAQIWTKIRSKQHARENARATLHPNKEISN